MIDVEKDKIVKLENDSRFLDVERKLENLKPESMENR